MSKKIGPFIIDPEPSDYIGSGSETDMGIGSGECLFWAIVLMLFPILAIGIPLLMKGS